MNEIIEVIDWSAITIAPRLRTEGYVPRTRDYLSPDAYHEPGGVTIATCIDLGQMDKMDLRSLFIRRALINKLEPYIGLQGRKASEFLAKNPLTLTKCEAYLLDRAVREYVKEENEEYVLSKKGAILLKDIEELRLEPYDDQTGKPVTEWIEGATIGYGHLIIEDHWHRFKCGINQPQADVLFWEDVAKFEKVVTQHIVEPLTEEENEDLPPLLQHQFDALVLFAYNIGTFGFAGSSVVKLSTGQDEESEYTDLESAWKAWNQSQGSVNRGLINRRNAEWKMYTEAVYERW